MFVGNTRHWKRQTDWIRFSNTTIEMFGRNVTLKMLMSMFSSTHSKLIGVTQIPTQTNQSTPCSRNKHAKHTRCDRHATNVFWFLSRTIVLFLRWTFASTQIWQFSFQDIIIKTCKMCVHGKSNIYFRMQSPCFFGSLFSFVSRFVCRIDLDEIGCQTYRKNRHNSSQSRLLRNRSLDFPSEHLVCHVTLQTIWKKLK